MKPTVEYLRSRLAYDPETGVLTWKPKDVANPMDNNWNGKHAGRTVGFPNNTHCGGQKHLRMGLDGERYLVHVVAWAVYSGEWPTRDIDHKDTDGANNRWDNLRLATESQNIANAVMRKDNTTGYKGVVRVKTGKYVAQINIDGRVTHLGTFTDPTVAHEAYCTAAKKQFGVFARTN